MVTKIHSSHSKRELYEIIEVFDLRIDGYRDAMKMELCRSILYEISKVDEIKCDYDIFYIENKKELLDYLSNPNQSKVLTIKQKVEVMNIAKRIIAYCKNGFYLSSYYLDWEDIHGDALYISRYCDIPSCRRAINLFNTDYKLDKKIVPIITPKIKRIIDKQQMLKSDLVPKLTKIYKPVKIVFD
tara:strand:- start:260 stop:814 length:555 start_codon:yes stop_codon:yes gene_type:complete